jgi:hypothetical protein
MTNCGLPRSSVELYNGLSKTASFEHSDERGYGSLETLGYVFPLTDRTVVEAGNYFAFGVRAQFAKVRDQKSSYDETFR